MREPRYSILADIQDAIEQAKCGKLALYWQRTIQREYSCKKATPAEQQAYEQLQSILSEVPQWSGEEDLRHNMENIGGRVWFCHFWIDHDSMVQLTEDRNGEFTVAYVLDTDASPEVRREAALLAQKGLAECMQEWGITLLDAPVPGQMKYASLAEAASRLMQVLNDPESITGVKSVPPGRAACIGTMQNKGVWGTPQQAFCNAK